MTAADGPGSDGNGQRTGGVGRLGAVALLVSGVLVIYLLGVDLRWWTGGAAFDGSVNQVSVRDLPRMDSPLPRHVEHEFRGVPALSEAPVGRALALFRVGHLLDDVFVLGDDGVVRRLDVDTLAPTDEATTIDDAIPDWWMGTAGLSADGRSAVLGRRGGVAVVDLRQVVVTNHSTRGRVGQVMWVSDELVLIEREKDAASVLNVITGEERQQPNEGFRAIASTAHSPEAVVRWHDSPHGREGRMVRAEFAVWTLDGSLEHVHEFRIPRSLQRHGGWSGWRHRDRVAAIVFSSDGDTMLVFDHRVLGWNTVSGKVYRVAVFPSGTFAIALRDLSADAAAVAEDGLRPRRHHDPQPATGAPPRGF